jgi:protein-disulfide isomerase
VASPSRTRPNSRSRYGAALVDRHRLGQIASGVGFLALCAVAVLIVVSQAGGGSGGDTNLEDVGLVRDQLKGIPQHGTVLGDPNADVRVIEYADLQCPICRDLSIDVAPDLISQVVRKDVASYEMRQWTVIGKAPHEQSMLAAKAALAASEQNRYWNYVELFYRNQGGEESGYVTPAFLTAIAKGAGVKDIAKWNRDRSSDRWDAALAQTGSEAQSLGLGGTPSVVVEGPGGREVLTAPEFEDIEKAIQSVAPAAG